MEDEDKLDRQTEEALDHLRKKAVLTGCTSYVQRMLQIGFNRAATILERLEGDGILSEPDNTGTRHWLT